MNNYRLTTKFRESIVFSHVCLSVCSHGIPSYRAPLLCTEPAPPLDMFKLVQLGPHCTGTPPLPQDIFKLVHYDAHTVGKLAVGILLEYFLVQRKFNVRAAGWSYTNIPRLIYKKIHKENSERFFITGYLN